MPDDQVQFVSPTTGKVQPIDPEHWEEALGMGYRPTTHTVMYSPDGKRGMVPNAELKDYMKQGFQTAPKTQFEQNMTGEGISTRGAGAEAWEKIKGMFPTPEGPILSKQFWIGKQGPSMDFSKGGLAQAGHEAAHEYQRSTAAGSNPLAAAGSAAVVGAGSLGTGLSNIEQEQLAEKGEGEKIIGQSAVPAVAAAAGPFMEAPLRAASKLTPPGAVPVADVAGAVMHPKATALKWAAKQLFGETPPAAPVSKVSEGPGPYTGPASAKAAAKATNRKGGIPPPPPPPFGNVPIRPSAEVTSTAAPIGNAPLPEVPQGTPTPFPTVQPKVKAPASASAAGAEPTGATGTSLLSRGRTLITPGLEPDLNNPVHVKMINDYQTMSGPALRQLASAGDRFAAFVLRHMPRPQ